MDKRVDPTFSTNCIIDALEITFDNNITILQNAMDKHFVRLKVLLWSQKMLVLMLTLPLTISTENSWKEHGMIPYSLGYRVDVYMFPGPMELNC